MDVKLSVFGFRVRFRRADASAPVLDLVDGAVWLEGVLRLPTVALPPVVRRAPGF